MSAVSTIEYLRYIDGVTWPVTRIAIDCGTPAFVNRRAAALLKSWNSL